MPDIETVITCPLGSKCREVNKETGQIHQCAWYIKMQGQDTAGEHHDEWACSMAWMPILQTEVAGAVRQTSASVQSMRNIQDQRQVEAIQALEKHSA